MRLVFSRVFLAFLHKIAAHFCRSRFHEISYHLDHCLKYEFCEKFNIISNLLIEIEILHAWLLICFCNLPKSWKGSLHYGFSVIYQKVFVKSRIGKIFGKIMLSGPLQIKFNHNLDLKNGTHKKWHMLRLENSNKIRCVTAKLLFSMASMRERWRLIFAAKADDTHCMC